MKPLIILTGPTAVGKTALSISLDVYKRQVLDSSTRRNLELTETLREKQKRGSLLWVLDKTKTAMGARMLRTYIEQPLLEKETIEARLDAIEELNNNPIMREEIREYLNPVYDLERLVSRITYQSANPRDLVAFKSSLSMLPAIKYLLKDSSCDELKTVEEELDALEDVHALDVYKRQPVSRWSFMRISSVIFFLI